MNQSIIQTEIFRIEKNEQKKLMDLVIREISFEIKINGKRLITIAALPKNLYELALGFLYSEGLVLNTGEILNINYNEKIFSINFDLNIPQKRIESFYQTGKKTSGCGFTLSSSFDYKNRNDFANITLEFSKINKLIKRFQKSSELFFSTGGVHSCALVKNYKIIYFAEDIGRHNAMDKVIGMAKRDNYPLNDMFLVSSGRISSEIVKKAVRLGIPLIISQSATTSEAITLAYKYKLYLIGFARANRFNIYTGFKKLKIILSS